MRIRVEFETNDGKKHSTTIPEASEKSWYDFVFLNDGYVYMIGGTKIWQSEGSVLCAREVPVRWLQVTYGEYEPEVQEDATEYVVDVNTRFFKKAGSYEEALAQINAELDLIGADSYRETYDRTEQKN